MWELFLTEAVPGVWLLAWRWGAGLQLSAKPDAPFATLAKLLRLCASVSNHKMGILTSSYLTRDLGTQ